jgi:hypothetical protein
VSEPHKEITLTPTPLKIGTDWQIEIQHPSGKVEMIVGFEGESHARQWIKNGSKAWLKTRGYSDN